jgi:hypothetical protein
MSTSRLLIEENTRLGMAIAHFEQMLVAPEAHSRTSARDAIATLLATRLKWGPAWGVSRALAIESGAWGWVRDGARLRQSGSA